MGSAWGGDLASMWCIARAPCPGAGPWGWRRQGIFLLARGGRRSYKSYKVRINVRVMVDFWSILARPTQPDAVMSFIAAQPPHQPKRAIILCNLGGADGAKSVRPFLFNLFSDPNILPMPGIVRVPLAALISFIRAPYSRKLYARMGEESVLFRETDAQARALESVARAAGWNTRVFISMRYWHPFAAETIAQVKAWEPEEVIVLPLYPQFSSTTTGSIVNVLRDEAKAQKLSAKIHTICCWPLLDGFVDTMAAKIATALHDCRMRGYPARLLMSAHGLPEKLIARGDPYQWQVEKTANAIGRRLIDTEPLLHGLDWRICYQSRVGPVKWIGPSIEDELQRAAQDKCAVVVAPIAFVSEHLETLVELDETMKDLAASVGVPHYARVATTSVQPDFIHALFRMAESCIGGPHVCSSGAQRLCPSTFGSCMNVGAVSEQISL
jgi:protoporphyrin/coproporphyrin ferrochelatase